MFQYSISDVNWGIFILAWFTCSQLLNPDDFIRLLSLEFIFSTLPDYHHLFWFKAIEF